MIRIIYLFLLLSGMAYISGQRMPNITLSTMEGKKFSTADMPSRDPVVMIFWATWCLPCIDELNTVSSLYSTWQSRVPFKIVAVATDDSRTASKVKTFVQSREWPFEIVPDPNQALKRALHINSIPHVLIIHDGKIVYSHTGYSPGDEDDLLAEIQKHHSGKNPGQ